MIGFITVATAMAGLALLMIVPPMLRRRAPRHDSSPDLVNTALYQDKLVELERDLADGVLTPDRFAQAQAELQGSFCEELNPTASANHSAAFWGAPVIGAAVPAVAVVLYLYLGAGAQALNPTPTAHPYSDTQPATTAPSVATLIDRLEQRLEFTPDDAQGWALLAKSYQHVKRSDAAQAAYERARALGSDVELEPQPQIAATGGDDGESIVSGLTKRLERDPADGQGWALLGRSYQQLSRHSEAAAAFAKAVELIAGDAQLWADYADVLAAAHDKRLAGEPEKLVAKALALDPDHPKSLWLAGTAALQGNDLQSAARHWQQLYGLLPADSADAEVIAANLAQIRQARVGAEPLVKVAEAASTVAAGGSKEVRGVVSLDPRLADSLSQTDTLFIFAKALNGPPMPLAVARGPARDFPVSFVLDDSLAMMPGRKLSDFDQVSVAARVSKTGNAMPQTGDLISASQTVAPGDDVELRLIIKERVP